MYLDIFVSILIGFFTLRGLLTGFIFEIFSFAGLFGAALLTKKYVELFYQKLVLFLKIDSAQKGIDANFSIFAFSYLITFFAFYIVFYFLATILQRILKSVKLGWLDSFLGSILGFIKGAIISSLIVAFLMFLSPYSEMVNDALKDSSSKKLVGNMKVLLTLLPDSFKGKIENIGDVEQIGKNVLLNNLNKESDKTSTVEQDESNDLEEEEN